MAPRQSLAVSCTKVADPPPPELSQQLSGLVSRVTLCECCDVPEHRCFSVSYLLCRHALLLCGSVLTWQSSCALERKFGLPPDASRATSPVRRGSEEMTPAGRLSLWARARGGWTTARVAIAALPRWVPDGSTCTSQFMKSGSGGGHIPMQCAF